MQSSQPTAQISSRQKKGKESLRFWSLILMFQFVLVHKIPERYLKHHFQYHTEQKEMYALVVKRNFTFHKWKYHLVKG